MEKYEQNKQKDMNKSQHTQYLVCCHSIIIVHFERVRDLSNVLLNMIGETPNRSMILNLPPNAFSNPFERVRFCSIQNN